MHDLYKSSPSIFVLALLQDPELLEQLVETANVET